MRRTTVRRTALAASALSLALLSTACGSEGSDKEEPKGKGSSSAPATPAGKALSQAELDKLVLAEADLKDHKIAKATPADLAAAKTVTTDKAACKPLVDVMVLRGVGTPGATATRKVIAVPKGPGANASAEEKAKAGLDALGATITADTLASYSGSGAADALAALKKAGTDCAGGFALMAQGDKTNFTKVAPASYTGGDEAIAFTLTADLDGEPGTAHLVAVRKGSTLATFYAQSLAGKAEQPKAVIDAQLKKLN
ncbi:hypothetical protein A8W25_23620 [Streptomyces sp. ERV7]|uniref:hypothetical protein n=1 Tax=Streptomyces sp. ERV7 TaxID=1322334 RepID=UPI0007F46326|nr:hypothetical protein [Streptomyces sp. ERV7]OAR22606.1 hypothetical protein A8W25_23620 [Streptomyces sp. ERV7]